ncbi:MAG: O-acetylhomoserine aminocarboxypropyltransferase/cysteine synthase [Treponema sp.]|nr:O-acetylhomoserine aminocarboxypropyltransferase/cysteine synthase [Treponema sp.]MCL2236642.1 O-acetylhomoserine aminocarboxypropyltransferase/cysteine synthase [Treponema sp.]
MQAKNYRFETLQVQAGQEPDSATGARAVPIYQTTAYVYPDSKTAAGRFALSEGGNIYSRITNPTWDVFEKRMAALEHGAAALCTASGQAAVFYAVMNICKTGDHIVSSKYVYGGTYNLFANTLSEMGVEVSFVDPKDISNFEKAIKPNTKAIFFETLDNPNSTIIDIEAASNIAHKNGIPVIVDNTLLSPFLLKPIECGADIVVHSASKYINGNSNSIGGVIIDGGKFDWAQNDKFPGLSKPNPSYHGLVFTEAAKNIAFIIKARTTLLRDTGACMSPFNAFLMLQGVETLSLRMERHTYNALKVVEFLKSHPQVEKVNHPSLGEHPYNNIYKRYFPNGAGSVFTFDIKGDAKKANLFSEKLKLFSLVSDLADLKSLVIHPASTTHSQIDEKDLMESGIKANSIRLSIGIEHIDDIIDDLKQAFEAVK